MTASRLLQVTLSIGLLTALGFAPVAEAGRIKCWTNNEGVRECGNVVPPEYAQKGHTTKSAAGVTTAVTKRAKTKEELEAERAEKERRKAEEREKARADALQAEKDRVLLSTYTSEEDLVLARNGKLAAIDSRIKHSRQVMAGLEKKLFGLQDKAAKRERSGKKLDKKLIDEITNTEKQIQDNRTFVADREKEKININEQSATDLARWRELKGK